MACNDPLRGYLNDMKEIVAFARIDAGVVFEPSEKKVTVRSANTALEAARLNGQSDEIATVSYTHLDVYKRQIHLSSESSPNH